MGQIFFSLGGYKSSLEDWTGALEEFNKALEIAPGNARYLYNLAVAKYKTGDYSGAMAALEKAVSLGYMNQSDFLESEIKAHLKAK